MNCKLKVYSLKNQRIDFLSKKVKKFVKQISRYLLRKMSIYDIKYNSIL